MLLTAKSAGVIPGGRAGGAVPLLWLSSDDIGATCQSIFLYPPPRKTTIDKFFEDIQIRKISG